jgi:hypothetical protein
MATYYVDYTNGSNTHDGLGEGVGSPITSETGTDATHIYVTKDVLDKTSDDDYNGDYLYNVTRSAGAIISDYDYDNGGGYSVITHGNIASQTDSDTFYILRSFKTIEQFTENARSAGDACKVRGGQTHTQNASDIGFTSDGSIVNQITLKGCYTAGDDPWGDGATTRPIIDFANTNYQMLLYNDRFWTIEAFDFKRTYDPGGITVSASGHAIIKDCRFYDIGNSANDGGIDFGNSMHCKVEDCVFDNCFGFGISVSTSEVMITGCTFDGDGDAAIGAAALSMDYGLKMFSGMAYVKDCVFGGDTNGDHDTADIYMYTSSYVYGRNNKLDSATQISWAYTLESGHVSIEDDEQTHKAYKRHYFNGTVEYSTAVERSGSGGSSWSILGTPTAQCDTGRPLYLIGGWLRGFPIYLDGTEQTIVFYAYCDSTGGSWTPSAADFYFQIDHYESSGVRALDVSSDSFAAEDTWETWTITLTPGAAGFAYVSAVLEEYVAGAKIYIDPVPTIDGNRDESLIACTIEGAMPGYEYVAGGAASGVRNPLGGTIS